MNSRDAPRRIEPRHGAEQRAGIFVLGLGEDALDPAGFDISAEDENESWAALLGLGSDRLAVYSRFDPLTNGMRMRLRTLTPAP